MGSPERTRFEASPADVRLVAVTRRFIEELLSSTATEAASSSATALVAEAVAAVAAGASPRQYVRVRDTDGSGRGPYGAVTGMLNPLAPPVDVTVVAGDPFPVLTGVVTYGFAYEGPPGIVHGGFIAAAFDELLGLAQSSVETPRVTAQLDISYRSPAPLRTELRYTCQVYRVEGRKVFARGALHHGDTLCAEATGLFIALREDRFDALMGMRGELT